MTDVLSDANARALLSRVAARLGSKAVVVHAQDKLAFERSSRHAAVRRDAIKSRNDEQAVQDVEEPDAKKYRKRRNFRVPRLDRKP